MKLTSKDISEGAGSSEERDHLSDREDLSNVEADPSGLMKKEKRLMKSNAS